MAILNSTLRLSLLDQVSGRAKIINSSLNSIRATQSALIGTFGRVAAFGAAYLGVSQGISGSVGAARDMQAALSEIAIKSDMTAGQIEQLRGRMLKLAPAVNQATKELIGGVDTMVTMGLGVNDAAAAIPAIGKAATATKSSITDLSAATVSAIQNMGVASGDITKMLDGMASAGNAGAFEMRDMAQYFPELTASAKALGMTGVDSITDMAAALQIARRGAGDASTAANNMSNFLGKIMAPATIKNFKKFGVDVTKELQKAHKKGISPIEHFIALVDEKTEGGKADLLGQLFGDKQVLEFVRPMLADFKDYIRIRGEAERASGTVADAYARRMEDANEKIKAFQIRVENLGASIGARLLGPLGDVADYFTNIFDTADHRVTVFDRLTSAIKGFVAGLGFDGSDGLKSLGDMIFGIAGKDGTAAGEELGRIAYKFRQFGESVKKVADAVKDSPIATFMTELAAAIGVLAVSKWARLFIVAWGIKALIEAVAGADSIGEFVDQLKNLSAMEWAGIGVGFILVANKVRKLVNAFRDLAKVTPKSLPGTPGKPPAGGTPPAAGGSALGAIAKRIAGIVGLGYMSYEGAKTITSPSDELTNAPRSAWGVDDALRSLWKSFNTSGGSPYAAEAERIRAQQAANDPLAAVKQRYGIDQPVRIDASSIGEITRKSGVQDVREINKHPPVVNVNVGGVTISGVSDPKAAADATLGRIGEISRNAYEASFSD